jgi:IS4 transposase
MRVLDELIPEPGALYVMDRGYLDFARLYRLTQAAAFFVIRAKRNFKFYRVQSRPVDTESGLICDQTVRPSGVRAPTTYPGHLRRIKYRDPESGRIFIYLSNNFTLPALTIAELYKCRWQVELFFKWIKQHLRIKRFFGTSENAVKSQVWIAISVYLLIAILKKRLDSPFSLYTIMQVLSVTVFEKLPLIQILKNTELSHNESLEHNQLNLFGY